MPKFSSNTTIDLRAQDDLIRTKGEWVWYFKGSRCPCGSEPNKPDFSCPNCQGLGHFTPDPPSWMRSIISAIKPTRDPFGVPGFVIPGDLTLVARPYRGKYWQLYDWDIIQLTSIEGIPLEGEDIIADPSGIDRLQHPFVELKSAYGINSYDTSAVNSIVTYVPGVDFTAVEPDGVKNKYSQSIQWLTDNRPRPGAKFVIQYSSQPFWIIFNPPNPHIERGVSFGQSVVLRKRSIVLANMA